MLFYVKLKNPLPGVRSEIFFFYNEREAEENSLPACTPCSTTADRSAVTHPVPRKGTSGVKPCKA